VFKAPNFKDDGAVEAFAQRFLAEGIAHERLEFRGPVGLTDMMAEYADVDIALDPVPYNGGTTTLQAMWMGVPVVVKAGSNFVSRMGASFMTAAGLTDWVAQTDVDYVRIAAAMARDRQVCYHSNVVCVSACRLARPGTSTGTPSTSRAPCARCGWLTAVARKKTIPITVLRRKRKRPYSG